MKSFMIFYNLLQNHYFFELIISHFRCINSDTKHYNFIGQINLSDLSKLQKNSRNEFDRILLE